jgi:arsenite methyltransferase
LDSKVNKYIFESEPLMAGNEEIKRAVRESYGALAKRSSSLDMVSCCEPTGESKQEKLLRYGYSSAELEWIPESVKVMSDGCGSPTGLAMIKEGDTVLDLGSGGGIDVLLASRKVGPGGKVIGLDMTPAMISAAGGNASRLQLDNVEFRLGEIEKIPLEDGSVDVIMSNCVICLSPDKEAVFREMFRVLRRGGRIAIADEVATTSFTGAERADPEKWCSCVSGAITEDEYRRALSRARFARIYVKQLRPSSSQLPNVFSAFISATKP